MNELAQHEEFEIAVLQLLKNRGLLSGFIFAGGTMLRLCYELNRYSVDLDFFARQATDAATHLTALTETIASRYEVTDAACKRNTVLCELRSAGRPRRLKLEFRTDAARYDYQQRIAFSTHSTIQVILDVPTLEEALHMKVKAALDRQIIRDFFDIEFILRRGVVLAVPERTRAELRRIIAAFTPRDYSTVLGSMLAPDDRAYYSAHGFEYLERKLS
jgi:predicted nucleotidyltransferase component of viral defense system